MKHHTDSVDPSLLLEYLSPTQRAEFDELLHDSNKIEALMSAHDGFQSPWWEDQVDDRDDEDEEEDDVVVGSKAKRKTINRPELLATDSLPPLKLDNEGHPLVGAGLLNNIVAVL